MRHFLITFWFAFFGVQGYSQTAEDTLGGFVSYVTSQSVYVKFSSTRDITPGDTLYTIASGEYTPTLIVKHISSTSCVGTPLAGQTFEKGNRIIVRKKASLIRQDSAAQDSQQIVFSEPEGIEVEQIHIEEDSTTAKTKRNNLEKTSLKGRLSATAYVNFSDRPESDQQRMRYVFSANARRINQTGLSAEVYLSFRHTMNHWNEVEDNFLRAFRVFGLSLEYNLDNGLRFWAGRKINYNIANIGAIDGAQAEKKWRNILVGVFAGSRPDNTDYGFNPNLVQYGGYVGNTMEGKNGLTQNTLAIVEQRNNNMTDRRFIYFQHINAAIKRINIFSSFEFDLYTLEDDKPKNTFDITSLYVSIRYRATDKLSFFGSFDARNNIIYYETYKSYLDQLLDEQMRQGFRFSLNYRPWKKISIGTNAGYRYQQDTPGDSRNLNSYITVSRLPGLQVSATATLTMIHSPYLDGLVYGLRMSRDIIKGKLFGEVQYRIADYRYRNTETSIHQSIAGLNLSWRCSKNLSFAVNYEGEIQTERVNNRFFTNIIQRF